MYKYPRRKHPKYRTLKEYFDYSTDKYSSKVAFVDLKDNSAITYEEFKNKTIYAAYSLANKLKKKNVKCGIVSENSTVYMMSYFSIMCSSNVMVLLAGDLDEDTLTYQLDHTDCEVIFVSEKYLNKIYSIKNNLPKVKYIISIDNIQCNDAIIFDDLIEEGQNNSKEAYKKYNSLNIVPSQLCQILYTSGTSGFNKAVMLTHENVCCSVYSALVHFGRYDNTIAILPFYHSYENSCHVLPTMFFGGTDYINDTLTHVMRNLKDTPAEAAVVVPMVLDTIASRIRAEAKRLQATKYMMAGIKASNFLRFFGIDLREKWFKVILSKFSDSLRTFIVGGAAINTDTYDLLTSVGFTIINGYGETECAPLIACNTPEKHDREAVGKVIEDMEVKIGEKDDNGNGEILVKGKGVMLGYYNDEEATKKVFDEDGWLRTGDIGHFDVAGRLHLCGRSKNLIILSNGKNVYPEELEGLLLKNIKYIDEVIVHTDEKNTGIFATVYLNDAFTEDKSNDEIYSIIKADILKFNKKMPSYKYINNVYIKKEPFKKNINQKIVRTSMGEL